MTKLLLSLHVLAAVLAIGPVAVAASMFPPALRRAHSAADAASDTAEALSHLRLLHRICHVYAIIGIAVPLFGAATAGSLGVLGSGWLIASIALTAAAAVILVVLILPTQETALTTAQGPDAGSVTAVAGRLGMLTGVFNLLWATVTILMIIRPGSTTGA
ncbi:membrane protein [Streptomyces sp. AcH 505]|uniref:membrane protein n=1 Tax=Streptomyces sp. AcH 505 TaxID=352211 RepID=UPI000592030E|nr:membrane protein [Streptomyces sp. AcH 505]